MEELEEERLQLERENAEKQKQIDFEKSVSVNSLPNSDREKYPFGQVSNETNIQTVNEDASVISGTTWNYNAKRAHNTPLTSDGKQMVPYADEATGFSGSDSPRLNRRHNADNRSFGSDPVQDVYFFL